MNPHALDRGPLGREIEPNTPGSSRRSAYGLAVIFAFVAGLVIGQLGAGTATPVAPHPLPRPRQLFP